MEDLSNPTQTFDVLQMKNSLFATLLLILNYAQLRMLKDFNVGLV
jgi:hypothetical protein